MNLELDDMQRDVLAAVRQLMSRHAGSERASQLSTSGDVDHEIMQVLDQSGFLRRRAEGWGLVEAVLVIEAAARAGVRAPVAQHVLVAQHLFGPQAPVMVSITEDPRRPVIYGSHADVVVVVDGSSVGCLREPSIVDSTTVGPAFPVATLSGVVDQLDASADVVRSLWRLGLAAEIAGLTAAAVEVAAAHVRVREQFGRPLSDFQGVQHRLAEAHIAATATQWLTLRAAALDADPELTAAAATYACRAAESVIIHTHRVCGAIGITQEFGLSTSTMRLRVLARELGGRPAHARALAGVRYVDQPAEGVTAVNQTEGTVTIR